MAPDINAVDWDALDRKVQRLREASGESRLRFDVKTYRLRGNSVKKYDFIKAWAQQLNLSVDELLVDCYKK